jgi:hypothetical protein
MTHKEQFKYGHYFFHFGVKSDSLADGPPLVCLNGGIMADTGSESLSYIYVCQDRYPVYAGLSGMRCLFDAYGKHSGTLHQWATDCKP